MVLCGGINSHTIRIYHVHIYTYIYIYIISSIYKFIYVYIYIYLGNYRRGRTLVCGEFWNSPLMFLLPCVFDIVRLTPASNVVLVGVWEILGALLLSVVACDDCIKHSLRRIHSLSLSLSLHSPMIMIHW